MISASMVKELRESTGAGMLDCKKALEASNGNMEEAITWLREKGISKAAKKASRIAAEGLAKVIANEEKAVIVEVNSETDFVAKNDEFQKFVSAVAEQAMATKTTDVEEFLAEKWALENEKTVKEALLEKVAVIGEHLSIRRFEKVVAENGCVVSYTHAGGRIAVIVEATTDVVNADIEAALSNVAMQIAALAPKYVSTDEISEEYKSHEKEILLAQVKNDPKNAGKPDAIVEKMIEGRLNKELKEVCLLEQAYVKAEDGKQTVAGYIAEIAKANSANLSIAKFVRFETGEGIEKKEEDFAAEVAKQLM